MKLRLILSIYLTIQFVNKSNSMEKLADSGCFGGYIKV